MTIDNQPSDYSTTVPPEIPLKRVNWKQVGAFIGLTFGLTWTLDLVLFLNGGLGSPVTMIALQLQMLLPAFSAILLGMFFFRDSPIHVRVNRSKARWFTWYFLVFTVLYAAALALILIRPGLLTAVSSVMLIPSLVGLALAIVLRALGGKGTFERIGMAGAGRSCGSSTAWGSSCSRGCKPY